MTLLRLFVFSMILLNSLTWRVVAEFPQKPLRIVVYTGPGGLIDTTSRKLASIMEAQNPKLQVIVENRKGAGGLAALTWVLSRPADGYTLMGLTSSVISKLVAAGQEQRLANLDLLARVVIDYESLITRKGAGLDTLTNIIEQSKKTPLLWAGPAAGGTDNLFAKKIWKEAGIDGKWIPYPGGNQAIAAVLGGHAAVYVGNPQDVAGREDLQVVAIASPERLSGFPQSQTFLEGGFASLEEEVLWRGFALKKGVPQKDRERLTELVKRAVDSEEWNKFVIEGSAVPRWDKGVVFQQYVEAQVANDKRFLQ